MENVRKFISDLKESYGEPREGFERYKQNCVPFCLPTSVPELSIHWELPEDEILHEIMVQPFYDSRTLQAKDSDVLVVGYPKSGSTWTQEIVYLLANDADFNKATSAPIEVRSPFIEMPVCGIRGIDRLEEPRVIKSCLSYDLLPPSYMANKAKIVYIARNPMDTVVSFYHFLSMLGYIGYNGTIAEFVDSFCQERLFYKSWARNVLGFWERRKQDNILFLFYEDLKKDLKSNLRKIAQFLDKSFTEEQLDQIVEHCSFERMKKNPMTNYLHGGTCVKIPNSKTDFLRKGTTGDWRNYLNDELSQKVDQYVEKNFRGTGIEFTYDL